MRPVDMRAPVARAMPTNRIRADGVWGTPEYNQSQSKLEKRGAAKRSPREVTRPVIRLETLRFEHIQPDSANDWLYELPCATTRGTQRQE